MRLAEGPIRPLLAGGASEMEELFTDPDPERAKRAMLAMLKMSKLDIAALRRAADEGPRP